MDKVKPTYLNGLEFIQVSSLPYLQASKLADWLPLSSYLRLIVHNIALEDCVLYKEYEYWFDYCYTKAGCLISMEF